MFKKLTIFVLHSLLLVHHHYCLSTPCLVAVPPFLMVRRTLCRSRSNDPNDSALLCSSHPTFPNGPASPRTTFPNGPARPCPTFPNGPALPPTQELSHCTAVVLAVSDDAGVRLLLDELVGAVSAPRAPLRYAAVRLLSVLCTNSRIDLTEHIPGLLRVSVRCMADDEPRVLAAAWDCLSAIVKVSGVPPPGTV